MLPCWQGRRRGGGFPCHAPLTLRGARQWEKKTHNRRLGRTDKVASPEYVATCKTSFLGPAGFSPTAALPARASLPRAPGPPLVKLHATHGNGGP